MILDANARVFGEGLALWNGCVMAGEQKKGADDAVSWFPMCGLDYPLVIADPNVDPFDDLRHSPIYQAA